MTTRRLRQVHPPGTEAGDPSTTPDLGPGLTMQDTGVDSDISMIVSAAGGWEGHIRLDDGRNVPFLARRDGQQVHVWIAGESYVFSPPAPAVHTRRSRQDAGDDIVCPVPGVVIAVYVSADDVVEAGQDLVIIESMKTEQIVKSHRQGTVQRVSVQEGDRVDRGMRLVVLFPVREE